jgi:hypothetical protein
MLQFWTEQGVLLPEADVLPEQQAEQQGVRSKILRWAAKYPRHRDVEFMADYMARVYSAMAASGWADQAVRFTLTTHDHISRSVGPVNMVQRAQAAQQELAAHRACLSPSRAS